MMWNRRGARTGLVRSVGNTVFASLLLVHLLTAGTCCAGWYRGDLHAHSTYSDGDSPVADVIARAESLGLDFFVITDHDTSMNGIPVHWADLGYHSEQLLLLYGVEWTTSLGHANLWSAAPFPYGEPWQANLDHDPDKALAAAHASGTLFSINHPSAYLATNAWQYQEVPDMDSIEVWNCMNRLPSLNGWSRHNFWDGLLESGRRVPGVGGSDTHHLEKWQSRFFGPGNPTTWIYVDDLTATAALSAIKAGHVAVSYAPDAVRLEFWADGNGDGTYETMMGDTLPEAEGAVRFEMQLKGLGQQQDAERGRVQELPPATVRQLAEGTLTVPDLLHAYAKEKEGTPTDLYGVGVFKNGLLFRVWIVAGGADTVTFADRPEGASYYRVELVGDPDVHGVDRLLYGRIVALTNPIYVGYAPDKTAGR